MKLRELLNLNAFGGSALFLTTVLGLCFAAGCAHKSDQGPVATFSPGLGAISGTLVNASGDALSADDRQSLASVQIRLLSADAGVIASSEPSKETATFVFNDVRPGRYEISAYDAAPGKSTIAGSMPVTVDPNRITPLKLTLQITKPDSSPKP